MSDVYKSEHYSCYNSTSDNVGSPGQIFIIISVSTSFTVMLSLLLLTLCSAIQVAKKLSSTSLNIDTYVEPDVIVVEESKDLTSQNSNQQLTLNSRDLLNEFYEKLPSSENSDDNHIQIPRSDRNSRHSSTFPSIQEEKEVLNHSNKHGSCGSLGYNNIPNYFRYHSAQRNSNSSIGTYGSINAYGTIPRKTNLRKMNSQEQVNQLTRFLFLNEDVELFKDNNPVSGRRGSCDPLGSTRKLSMDYLTSNLIPEGYGTLKKSMTSLARSPIIPAAIQRNKEKKKSLVGTGSQPLSPTPYKSPDEESMSSQASDVTLKAEPIIKIKVNPPKYIKNQKNNYDTLTYRRQRRVGVHFSQSIPEQESNV